ncbi:LRR and PYD domains-containing 3-like protein [Labeo rohita]|uniref:LRR and PYD domains-containing 3-like protein n=1 Tax=Labeo rohita TaxID=84645 RepID=A0A498NPV4_LABRO|nr:LRR and PYD domains-containing 3-like protein [Labeo rohita]
MEKADIFDTVDKMVECFGPEQSIEVMLDILRKMNQNDLAEQLKNKSKQAQAEGNMKKSVTVGGNSQQNWSKYQSLSVNGKKRKCNCKQQIQGQLHRTACPQ